MKKHFGSVLLLAVVVALPFLTVSLSGQCPPYQQAASGPCTQGLPTPIPTCTGVGYQTCPLPLDENNTVVEYDVNSTSNWAQAPSGNNSYTALASAQSLCWTRYKCYWVKDPGTCQRDNNTASPSNSFPYQTNMCPGG
jgi:hypothetical protein